MTKNEMLKKEMETKGMDVTEVAYVLGVREPTVRNWLRGSNMRKSVLILMAKVFKNNEFIQ